MCVNASTRQAPTEKMNMAHVERHTSLQTTADPNAWERTKVARGTENRMVIVNTHAAIVNGASVARAQTWPRQGVALYQDYILPTGSDKFDCKYRARGDGDGSSRGKTNL